MVGVALEKGGSPRRLGGQLCPKELKHIPAAAAAVGLTWCSVDYWLTDDHPKGIAINEINGFPALPPREAEPFAHAALAAVARISGPRVSQEAPVPGPSAADPLHQPADGSLPPHIDQPQAG